MWKHSHSKSLIEELVYQCTSWYVWVEILMIEPFHKLDPLLKKSFTCRGTTEDDFFTVSFTQRGVAYQRYMVRLFSHVCLHIIKISCNASFLVPRGRIPIPSLPRFFCQAFSRYFLYPMGLPSWELSHIPSKSQHSESIFRNSRLVEYRLVPGEGIPPPSDN